MTRDAERCLLEPHVLGPGDGLPCWNGPADGRRFAKREGEPARVIVAVMGVAPVRDLGSAGEAAVGPTILYYVPGAQLPPLSSLVGCYILRGRVYSWCA